MTKSLALTKITCPRLSGVYDRERFSSLLDDARGTAVIWIAAPAGSGKTTAVAAYLNVRKMVPLWYQVDAGDGDLASFFYYLGLAAKKAAPRHRKPLPLLTPEYLLGIPVFTRRYFENLFRRLTPPAILVFDDYQNVADDSGFHEMMAHALEVVPEGIRVIVLSRSEPPPQLTRLRANKRIVLLGWEEVRFTRDESAGLLATHGLEDAPDGVLDSLYQKTGGWAAGLVLLLERGKRSALETGNLDHLTRHEIFDYFASEMFNRADQAVQEVLLKTSFLAKFKPLMAEKLTGIRATGQILDRLSRDNFFTQRYEDAYQYHPLFREFLLARARSAFSGTHLEALQRNAAELLSEAAYTEEAIELLREAKAWERLNQLIQAHAPKLLAEGRNKTVGGWLRAIPEHLLGQMPWALYWLGTCCLPFDQIEARAHYEMAYCHFKESGNIVGRYLAWSGIAESFIYQWDDFSGMKPWLSELELLQKEHPRFPSAEVEARVILGAFSTLYYMDPGNLMVERWRRRIETLMYELPDPNFKCQAASNLVLYYLWYGGFADQRRIVDYIAKFRDHTEATPFSRILVRHAMACPDWMSGESERARALCEEGLQIGEQSGVHMLDRFLLAYQVYSYGCYHADTAAMKPLLDRMRDCVLPQRRLDAAHFHHIMAWYLSLCRRYDEALIHCREAAVLVKLSVVSPTAFVYINTAQILILAGRFDEAAANLAQAEEIVKRHGCVLAGYKASIVRAVLALKCGSKQEQVREVRNTLELAIRLGYWSYSIPHPDILLAMCAFALQEGIESDYAVSMIRRSGLQPPTDAPAAWPWPLQIHTLGRFEVLLDGGAVDFYGKRKILELLKVLVAFGGINVRGERIIDQLWADADGDDARNAFKMTVSRLRRFLPDEAILFQDGAFTLNRRLVWTDTWAFEQLHERAMAQWERGGRSAVSGAEAKVCIAEAMELTEKAINLYRGAFLSADSSQAWAAALRERLRNKILRLATTAGQHHENKGRWKSAALFYRRALDADHLQEEFYYRLMVCHQQLGQHHEARAVYERCRAELSAGLGINPSPKTESLFSR